MSVKRVAATFAVAAVLGVAGWRVFKAVKKPKEPAADVVAVREGPIENAIDATGSVSPLNRVEIKPPISGRIERLLVDEGDRVKAGDVLAWMSSSDRAAILDAARAQGPEELKRWQDAYKPTPIVAPLSGVIILRNVVVGQTVDPTTVLYAMSDKLIVVAQVDESDVGHIRVGMPARITLDAFPDRADAGKVFEILAEGKNVSNVIQYGVKIAVDPVPSYFKSQMTANVSFIQQRKVDAVLIPAAAVREAGGTKRVLVPGAEGEPPVSREIETGIESGESVEVVGGLQPGDKVLVSRNKYVPQQAAQTSPLTMGGRPTSPTGQAPKRKGK